VIPTLSNVISGSTRNEETVEMTQNDEALSSRSSRNKEESEDEEDEHNLSFDV
jgi:hypothetical protein